MSCSARHLDALCWIVKGLPGGSGSPACAPASADYGCEKPAMRMLVIQTGMF
jgi:hypothetical protein